MSKIEFVKGDIFKDLDTGVINYIAHCCNAQGVMGSGFAKQVKERYPEVFIDYKNFIQINKNNGIQSLGRVVASGKILNLIAQEFYGTDKRQLNYGALAKTLHMAYYHWCYNPDSYKVILGVPDLIGCGLAGGDRDIVLELLEHCTLGVSKVVVYSKE